jgi:hypothetical protein
MADQGLANSIFAVHEFIAITSAVAEEVTIYFPVIPVLDASNFTITLSSNGITTNTAMLANRGSHSEVPFPGIMILECFIGKYTRGTNFGQVSAKWAFQNPILLPPKINVVVSSKNVQVLTACVIPVISNAPVALNTTVHFMV